MASRGCAMGSRKTRAPHRKDTKTERPLHRACDTAKPAAWIATTAATPLATCAQGETPPSIDSSRPSATNPRWMLLHGNVPVPISYHTLCVPRPCNADRKQITWCNTDALEPMLLSHNEFHASISTRAPSFSGTNHETEQSLLARALIVQSCLNDRTQMEAPTSPHQVNFMGTTSNASQQVAKHAALL